MGTRSILLASADPQVLADISQTLGTEWMPTSVRTEPEARAQLEKYVFDALLIDFNLGSPDASDFLNLALETRPDTVRFLFAYEADLALVAAKVVGPHQLLPKPLELASLKRRVEDGVAAAEPKAKAVGSDSAVGPAPKVPAIYAEVLRLFESPEVTEQQVAELVAQDADLSAEVLRLTNSAYLSTPRKLSDPVEAVAALGLETVRTLVLALRFLAEHSHLRPGYISFEQVWQHNVTVALIARDLVLFETRDRALAAQALAGGLIHDLGKVVLSKNFDDLYARVHSLAQHQPVALWDIEKEMFGANHGEIGGCLVGMWNLPLAVVDAAALHHEPPLGEQQLTPVGAVHIANVLEHQLHPSEDYRVAPVMNTAFLNELGLLHRLPVWRAALANGGRANAESEPEPTPVAPVGAAARVRPAASVPSPAQPAVATRTATSTQPVEPGVVAVRASRLWPKPWAYVGAAVVLLILVVLWHGSHRDLGESLPAHARTPAPAPLVAARTTPADGTPAASAPAAPARSVAAELAKRTVSPEPEPAPAEPEPAPASEPPPVPTASLAPTVSPTPVTPTPEFRLSGIIYTANHPSAFVNGVLVHVGDQVKGASVVAIGPKQVTLRFNGRLKTYDLR